jgi:RNA polymerase sigma-70 factor (ECF subfamily)
LPRDDEVRSELLRALPHLRAFAMSLTQEPDRADDLVQQSIMRALSHLHQFEWGTNFQGWMFRILRNEFHTTFRKRRREVEDIDGAYSLKLAVPPAQSGYLEFEEMRAALGRLSVHQREALLLVCAEGRSYEEAAEICSTAIGTIKSRVNRARKRLAELLGHEQGEELGLHPVVLASIERCTATSAA